GRGARVTSYLDDKTFDLLDALEAIAKTHGKSVAQIALAWVQGRPGVTSTIIGARTIEQLDDNLGALDVTLTTDEIASLDKLTKPSFGFPLDMLAMVPSFAFGGTTINGTPSKVWAQAPQNDKERF
ncbi:MAG: aldo/keto reductase, partial [Polyangiaceae bacterium]